MVSLSNPTLTVMGGAKLEAKKVPEASAVLAVPFDLGGRPGARADAAGAAVDSAKAGAEDALRGIVRETLLRWARALRAQRGIALAKTRREVAPKLVAITVRRAATGDIAKGDATVFEVEFGREDARLSAATGLSAARRTMLVANIGAPEDSQVAGELVAASPPGSLDTLLSSIEKRPDVRAAVAAVNAAGTQVGLAKADVWPTIGVIGSWEYHEAANIVTVGLSVPFPLFNANKPAISIANAKVTAAQAELAAERRDGVAEPKSSYASWTAARDAYEALTKVATLAEGAVVRAVKAHDGGTSGSPMCCCCGGRRRIIGLLDAHRVGRDLRRSCATSTSRSNRVNSGAPASRRRRWRRRSRRSSNTRYPRSPARCRSRSRCAPTSSSPAFARTLPFSYTRATSSSWRRWGRRSPTSCAQSPGATDVRLEQVAGLQYLKVQPDRAKLARYGLTIEDVNTVTETLAVGHHVGEVLEGERRFGIVVKTKHAYQEGLESLLALPLRAVTGQVVPLGDLADLRFATGPAQISREKQSRRITVDFNVRGRDLLSVVRDAQAAVQREVRLPTAYHLEWGGQFEHYIEARERLALVVPLALGLILFLLWMAFREMRAALLIFINVPFAIVGGVFALWIRSIPFSISAGVGFVALFGVAVLNGLVLVSFARHLESEGIDHADAIRQAAEMRLRPVLMTALVASLGFVPMALSTAPGSEVQRPLASVVIGGLITATALTLLVLPVVYAALGRAPRSKQKETPRAGA